MDPMNLFSKPTAEWFQTTFSQPTKVQEEAWSAIADGKPVLVSAPTGTGKTLSAFLYFIDDLKKQSREGTLKQELQLIYISPLKSLATDIKENLRRPLDEIEETTDITEIKVAVRTGDTPQKERRQMIKNPPHILITTPESLYLMLTAQSGRTILKTAKAIILDELHALIDTKRGAHLMLSLARLDALCGQNLQRIGLSATIEPLDLAAAYLSPEPAVIAAPAMTKKVKIEVVGVTLPEGRRKDPVWEELGRVVYERCMSCRSVIAFCEGRRNAEKIAYYVNELGGADFARVHHGSVSKEQRMEVEQELRNGTLRLLCATSSMELGIDVGEIDEVLQIGCPRTVSGTMQRLGRAGHNPGRVSNMYMYPRTAPEALYCGLTAEVARTGGIEYASPPKKCLDVLAQHLVSMAAGSDYTIDEVMELLSRTYSFYDVTRDDVKNTLCMLAGDYEHSREIPVRPRILYDRIHERVMGDTYSRMLAVAAGGTIPDKGLYSVRTEDGVKLGELDEEFVYESRMGDRFVLGSFAWRIIRQDKDNVIVSQVPLEGAKLPFWKGEIGGRALKTSLSFGKILGKLEQAYENEKLSEALRDLGLDEAAGRNVAGFIERQIKATGGLPDDKTIIVEHFRDSTGSNQIMVHSLFGKRVNAPLSILMQQVARKASGLNVGCVEEEDGFLLYPYGKEELPYDLLYQIDPETVREILETILPVTPLFGITFRYNAARALMMGMKQNGRTPLWAQRLRSTQMLDSLISCSDHPLIQETRRECLEDLWDIDGAIGILHGIRSGMIVVREMTLEVPSPMSLPLQWQVEAAEMYEYAPTTQGIHQSVYEKLNGMEMLKPSEEELLKLSERKKLPQDEMQLHSLLMMEGDIFAGELDVPVKWMEQLAIQGRVVIIEPGLWIAAENQETYEKALQQQDKEAAASIIRRMLYYRGAHSIQGIMERYLLPEKLVQEILTDLCRKNEAIEDNALYFHAKIYDRARKNTVKNLRMQVTTKPGASYAALLAGRATRNDNGVSQLEKTIKLYCNQAYPVSFWETVLFPARIKNYSEAMLDKVLSQGEFFWQMFPDDSLCFRRYEDVDWNGDLPEPELYEVEDERTLYRELQRRGASFINSLSTVLESGEVRETLLNLAQKGVVCADSFVPVRQWQNRDKIKKATARQRVNARVMALSAGRWDIIRPLREFTVEDMLSQLFAENLILCRETYLKSVNNMIKSATFDEINWGQVLEKLCIWEFTGRVRRGYFIAGMSGAQFIRKEDYDAVICALDRPETEVVWLNASDPAQIWGKVLPHLPQKAFVNIPGTLVAVHAGMPIMVLERKGKTLRIFEDKVFDETLMTEALTTFIQAFKRKQFFPELKRLIVKDYPKNAVDALMAAGFMKEMNDYVLYK